MQGMELKYQLPSDPSVYVDLLDDEDVRLMFDEVTSPAILLPVMGSCRAGGPTCASVATSQRSSVWGHWRRLA